jgi:hypothetical protein
MAARNALSVAADGLFEALERAAALYIAEHPGHPLRVYRTPPLQPTTPAVWIGIPSVVFIDPYFAASFPVSIVVDGDQPEQADVLYEIIGRVFDEVSRADGFHPESVQPITAPIHGTEGTQSALGAVIAVDHTVGARTLCPPEMADAIA